MDKAAYYMYKIKKYTSKLEQCASLHSSQNKLIGIKGAGLFDGTIPDGYYIVPQEVADDIRSGDRRIVKQAMHKVSGRMYFFEQLASSMGPSIWGSVDDHRLNGNYIFDIRKVNTTIENETITVSLSDESASISLAHATPSKVTLNDKTLKWDDMNLTRALLFIALDALFTGQDTESKIQAYIDEYKRVEREDRGAVLDKIAKENKGFVCIKVSCNKLQDTCYNYKIEI